MKRGIGGSPGPCRGIIAAIGPTEIASHRRSKIPGSNDGGRRPACARVKSVGNINQQATYHIADKGGDHEPYAHKCRQRGERSGREACDLPRSAYRASRSASSSTPYQSQGLHHPFMLSSPAHGMTAASCGHPKAPAFQSATAPHEMRGMLIYRPYLR